MTGKHEIKLALLFLTAVAALSGRVSATRVAPESSVRFDSIDGHIGGRTEWFARAAGAWLLLTSNEVVYALLPEGTVDPKKRRGVPNPNTDVHMSLIGARRKKRIGEKPLGGSVRVLCLAPLGLTVTEGAQVLGVK